MNAYDLLARFYDWGHEGFTADLDLYRELVRRTGGPVLDLGCGTGRVALALAQAGYAVVGVDSSAAMLEQARRKAAAASLEGRVQFIQADLEDFSLEGCFRLAVFALGTFCHLLDTAAQRQALRNVRRHLDTAGLLVLDQPNPLLRLLPADAVPQLHRHGPNPATGTQTMKFVVSRPDPAAQTEQVTLWYDEISPAGTIRRTMATLSLRHTFRYELVLLLEATGFTVEQVYGSYDLDEYTADSERLIVLARAV